MNLSSFALRRASALILMMAIAFVMAACSTDGGADATDDTESVAASAGAGGDGAAGGTATVESGVVQVSAESLAFDASTIEATAGEAFTITFVNNDSVPHNISVYQSQGGDAIVEGTVINQGETVEVEVPALDAGEYYFQCDVHPDMNGMVVVG